MKNRFYQGLALSAAGCLLSGMANGQALPETTLPEIEIKSSAVDSYNIQNAVSATKTDTPIQETPFAVQVVPEQTMLDQQTTRIQDAILGNVSSVAPNANGLSDNTNFTIRGFNTGPNVYRDGLLLPYSMNVDTANMSSIEVLKGPSAALYGRMPPGGLVDYVTKQPLDTPHYSAQLSLGSFRFVRAAVDLTGPVDADKTVLYRVNLASTSANSFVNFENSKNLFFAPSVTIKPNNKFELTMQAEYQKVSNVDSSPNFPAVGNGPANIPISTYLEDPSITTAYPDTMRKELFAYHWTYEIDDNWKISNRFTHNNLDESVTNMFGMNMDSSGNFSNALMYGPAGAKTLTTNLELTGKIKTQGLEHSLLFGADYLNFSTFFNGIYAQGYLPPSFTPGVQTINIYNPQAGYGTTPSLSSLLGDMTDNGFALYSKQTWRGIYSQDMISAFNNTVHLLIGGRYDWATTGSGSGYGPTAWLDANSNPGNVQNSFSPGYVQGNDGGFSPRIGLSVQVLPWANTYANYSKSLGLSNASTGVTVSGNPLPPQWSEQKEIGLKADFLENKVSATVAYFDITQTNMPSFVKAPDIYALIGEARSKGVEFSVQGEINKNWGLIATASHDQAQYTQGYTVPQSWLPNVTTGSRLAAVPQNMASLWVKYTGTADLLGWKYAAGVTAVSQAQGDPANDFQIPGYSVVRGMASYDFKVNAKKVTAQMNIDNALSQRYFYGSTAYGNRYSLTPGTPRSVMGTLRVEL
jgi:iron complex outermembrane recepter protein